VIFQWVEKLREFLQQFCDTTNLEPTKPAVINIPEKPAEKVEEVAVIHGEPLAAGKCTFQGHAARVKNVEQVK
jgi:hypothetical protein